MKRGLKEAIGRTQQTLTGRERNLRLLLLLLVLAIVVVVWLLRDWLPDINRQVVGYPAVFLLSLIGSASILLPIPSLAAVCAGGVLLVPLAVGLLAGLAEALGEFSGYGLGYGGRGIVEQQRLYQVACRWMEKRGTLVLFLASVIPNPAFDIIGIAAGGLRFPILRFFLAVWAGKTLKSLGIAYACYFSADAANRIFQWMAS